MNCTSTKAGLLIYGVAGACSHQVHFVELESLNLKNKLNLSYLKESSYRALQLTVYYLQCLSSEKDIYVLFLKHLIDKHFDMGVIKCTTEPSQPVTSVDLACGQSDVYDVSMFIPLILFSPTLSFCQLVIFCSPLLLPP